MGEGFLDQAIQNAGNWVAGKLSPGGFPTVSEGSLYPDPSPEDPKPEHSPIPVESKDTLFKNLEIFLRDRNSLPKPGCGLKIYLIASTQLLFGNEIKRGDNGRVFIDEADHTFTKVWEQIPDEKMVLQNVRQKELYKRLETKHPWFTFRREFPGGWSQEKIDNQGNLKEYLRNGGKISQDQINKVISQLRDAHQLAAEAHGDIMRHPKFFNSRSLIRPSDLDPLEPYGYVFPNNVLVNLDGDLVLADYGGTATPFPTADMNGPNAQNSKSNEFMTNELELFAAGLEKILENQSKNPFFYLQLADTVDIQLERENLVLESL